MNDPQLNLDKRVNLTHEQLCQRAKRWLHGTRHCNPVFSNLASCGEVRDAIGWSSVHNWRGSTVIECKRSVSDFYADKKKHIGYKHPEHGYVSYGGRRIAASVAKLQGYIPIEVPLMGDYRFYFFERGILSEELIAEHMP